MKAFFNTLLNIFKAPVTSRYPAEKTFIPDDYRGMIGFDENLCIWCRRCEMVCPPGAIVFSQDLEGKQAYHFSRAVCIYCGECVRACPKEGAIFQTGHPAELAVKEENINNKWNDLFDESLASRAAYTAEKKRRAAIKSALPKEESDSKPVE